MEVTQTILVVDDGIAVRHALVLQLDELGIVADSAANGCEALKRVYNHTYDLILMDIQMPEMNGIEATIAIRAHEKQIGHKPVPIIAITVGALGVNAKTCLLLGFNDYVEKPLVFEILESLVEKWIGPLDIEQAQCSGD